MAGVTNREFWDFRVKTRAQFTKLAEQIVNIDTSGGGGISELTSKMVVDALGYTPYNSNNPANYITYDALSPYAKTADVSITYATIASVQGFENRIGGLEGAVPQLNERVTTVEGKVSSLNETVSTGKNNLLDRVNTIETEYVTSGKLESAINDIDLSVYLLKADLTKSRIQSTLGISDWALASVKPPYTASEVGALGVKDTAQQSYGLRHSTTPISDSGLHWWSGQFQVSTEPVSGKVYLGSSGDYTVISVPKIDGTSSLANACVLRLGYNRQFFHEIFTSPNSNNIYHRNVNVGYGSPWRQFAFTSDIPTNLSQLTDDVVAGNYIRATVYRSGWDADSLYDAGVYSGNMSHLPSGLPYGVIYTLPYRKGLGNTKPDFGAQLFIPNGDDSTSPNDMFFRTGLADTWNAWNKVITDRNIKDQYVAGVYDSYNPLMKITFKYAGGGVTSNPAWLACWNDYTLTYVSPDNVKAGSATKLATRCKLWGQSFDGTGDVTHGFRSLCPNSYNGGVAHSILCNITAPYGLITRINGNGDVLQQAQRENTNAEWFNLILQPLGGNVGIGNTSPTERLDVSGNIKASGNINATSITINGVTITASNGSITVNGNVFAKGDITGGV